MCTRQEAFWTAYCLPLLQVIDYFTAPAVADEYCGDDCGVILFWDASTGRNISFYLDLPVFALAWSPDGRFIASGGDYGDNTVQVWEAASGPVLSRAKGAGWDSWGTAVSTSVTPW